MRFSDLAGKEIIDVREGLRLGELGDAELVFEVRTGKVRAIVVTPHGPWWRRSRELVIPWQGVRKIGVDVIVVDLGAGGEEPLEGGGAEAGDGRSLRGRGSADAGSGSQSFDGWRAGGETDGRSPNGQSPKEGGAHWPGVPGGPTFFFRRR